MERLRSAPSDGALLDIADCIGRTEKLDISDDDDFAKVLDKLVALTRNARSSDIMVHGRRVEAMFGYVASALGACTIVKREDSGDVFVATAKDYEIPDWRVVGSGFGEMLVEVKNCHTEPPNKEFSIRVKDLDRLERYATLFGKPLRLAVYWSRWQLWTLLPRGALRKRSSRAAINLLEALKANEMSTLGDFHLATVPPLQMKIQTHPAKPRTVSPSGEAQFTIKDFSLFAGGRQITTKVEKNLLLYLWFYGKWREPAPTADVINNELISLEFVAEPLERSPQQEFEIIGVMSSMIANQYNGLTTRAAVVTRLAPHLNPSELGRRIPGKIPDMELPLWVFKVTPGST
jgi:hypothetical protein